MPTMCGGLQEPPRKQPRVNSPSLSVKHRNSKYVSVDCSSILGRGVQASVRSIFSSWGRKETAAGEGEKRVLKGGKFDHLGGRQDHEVDEKSLKRCSWITKSSAEVYVSFHDKCWGVPVFQDRLLFELLALSGMLIDHSWTEILQRRELFREVFAGFDHKAVAEMNEKEIAKISRNKKLGLHVTRIRCIVDNAKCIQKVAGEFGSFSGYIWSHINHRPIIYKHRQNDSRRSIPLKTPKSEAISKDLVRRGFRLVSPVIIYSFMQAAGMAINHDIQCFRSNQCIKIAERSWGMTNLGM